MASEMTLSSQFLWFGPLPSAALGVLAASAAYVIYLSSAMHCAPELRLRRKGLDKVLSGHPSDAEKLFRKALALTDGSDRVRPMVCLADSLMDQGLYRESKEFLLAALELGDSSGSGHGSLADLLLLTGEDPNRAIELSREAMELGTSRRDKDIYFGGYVSDTVKRAKCLARTGHALAQLGKETGAREALSRATQMAKDAQAEAEHTGPRSSVVVWLVIGDRRLENHRGLVFATLHWKIGLAYLALGDSSGAADHFRITRSADRRGKYRSLAKVQLEQLGSSI
jgi:tetratricopeptide (TPR) repeat protein